MTEKNIRAVHESDLEHVLDNKGLLQDFLDGNLKCKFCGEVITHENVYSLLPESGAVNFICSKPECVELLNDHLSNIRQT